MESFEGVSTTGVFIKGFVFYMVTDIGMFVIWVFYRGVNLGVSIIGDVY